MKYTTLVKDIVRECGGKENIQNAWCCTTRLRFNMVDMGKVQVEHIQKLPHVMGTQEKNGQFQIIIGNDVEEVLGELMPLLDVKPKEPVKKEKGNVISTLIETISAIFTPILPAIIGAGMLKCLLSILTLAGIATETSDLYQLLYMVSDAAFYFLPFLIAVSASRKFNTNEFLGVTVAGILLYPTLINGAAQGLEPMMIFGLPIPYLSYSSSVIPIILGIYLFSIIYRFLERVIPNIFRFILTPMLAILITVPFLLMLLAPMGFYIGNWLSAELIWLFDKAGPVAGFILGGANPLIIMTGMHYAFMPAAIQSIATNGFDNFWLPFALISNLATAGSILAVVIKTKEKDGRAFALSTMISSVFGVTEPGLYGVQLKLKKPLYCSMCASAIAGCVAVLLGARTYSFSAPNILILPIYIAPDGDISPMIAIIVGLLIAFILALVLTLFSKCKGLSEPTKQDKPVATDKEESIYSPIHGRYVPLEDVQDMTFSSGAMGKGFAVLPEDGHVYAPVDGEIIMIFRTKHAMAIRSVSGMEIMIHIGIETVNLDGKYFDVKVKEGDFVHKGDLLSVFDLESLRKEGYDLTTPVILTNASEFPEFAVQTETKMLDTTSVVMNNQSL